MRRSVAGLVIALILLVVGLAFWQIANMKALPSLEYLGESGSYTIEPGRHFIVKRRGPFRFEQEPGPSYTAVGNERVWAAAVSPPAAKVDTWISYGTVSERCEINFTAIDDDEDERINVFYVGNEPIYEMTQGLVTSGSFQTDSGGELRLHAVDSIGVWLSKCESPEEPTATATIPSATPEPTETPTVTATGTILPSLTPTSTPITPEPEETPEATPDEPTPTPTKEWRLPSCSRINLDVSGDFAREGIYEMRELGGRHLYDWYAQEGWQDSGWYQDVDISFKDVYVQVFYLPPDGGPRISLRIVNPAPGTNYGWMSRGICHAVEVAWPEMMSLPDSTPDTRADEEALGTAKIIWPGQEPTPTETPSSSLRG